ncbi:MAG: hypothetical protein QOK05_677 [Chloroflexota bacterium]|jgi:putative lipase involved disintegration of autophagic bodies|nr:hypothetical protein [Chloroflexota bacterium]
MLFSGRLVGAGGLLALTLLTSGCGSSSSATSRTLFDFDASAAQKTENFQTHGKWDVVYSWDCSVAQAQGNKAANGFRFTVFNSDDDSTAAEDKPEVVLSGLTGKGTEHYRNAGIYYFKLNSLCKYRVRVLNVS